ncbi:MAG TPA: AMP-binding protein [Acidimicrobiia bacterium]|nr:AMP-binding protein [Acidimicrobiia bacterium]
MEPGQSTADGQWALSAVFDVVSDAVPDRTALVWRDRRRTYRETRGRVDALAAFLVERGFGRGEITPETPRWECPQERVALLLHNRPEHVEALLGCWRARAVPFNVNYRYTGPEVAGLLHAMGARAVIYERGLGEKLATVAATLEVCIEVDDGSDAPSLPGAVGFETALAAGDPSARLPAVGPDDRYLACTGGTTGRPKGVLWRQGDIFVAGMSGADGMTAHSLAQRATTGAMVWFPTSPLMHVAAQWTAMVGINQGATVILHDDAKPFDMDTILETAARERVNCMTMVGDVYARPMVERVQRRDLDLSSLAMLGTGGAPTSLELKRAIHDHLPHVMIRDGYGATEIGAAAFGTLPADGDDAQRFEAGPDLRVLSEDRTRFLAVTDDEVGWLARCNHVPLGYLDDPDATDALFPIVDGVRAAVPGDRARMEPDGRFVLLGRDSLVVNTGGEKVFVEEVEDALKRCKGVVDVVVVGRPEPRFGQEVVAIVALEPGVTADARELRDRCRELIARYKAPRAFLFVDRVRRHPSGKADYGWARERSADAIPVT